MTLHFKPALKVVFGILLLWFLLPASHMATTNMIDNQPNISAQIESKSGDGTITFTALAINYGGQEYSCTYTMIAHRFGPSGQCNNRQAGSVHLKPGNTTQLSQMTISATNKDSYKVTLQIHFNEDLIASDSLTHNTDQMPFTQIQTR